MTSKPQRSLLSPTPQLGWLFLTAAQQLPRLHPNTKLQPQELPVTCSTPRGRGRHMPLLSLVTGQIRGKQPTRLRWGVTVTTTTCKVGMGSSPGRVGVPPMQTGPSLERGHPPQHPLCPSDRHGCHPHLGTALQPQLTALPAMSTRSSSLGLPRTGQALSCKSFHQDGNSRLHQHLSQSLARATSDSRPKGCPTVKPLKLHGPHEIPPPILTETRPSSRSSGPACPDTSPSPRSPFRLRALCWRLWGVSTVHQQTQLHTRTTTAL